MTTSEKKMVFMFPHSSYISYSKFSFLMHCLGYSELRLEVIAIIFPDSTIFGEFLILFTEQEIQDNDNSHFKIRYLGKPLYLMTSTRIAMVLTEQIGSQQRREILKGQWLFRF